jgi:hypothetical protein
MRTHTHSPHSRSSIIGLIRRLSCKDLSHRYSRRLGHRLAVEG